MNEDFKKLAMQVFPGMQWVDRMYGLSTIVAGYSIVLSDHSITIDTLGTQHYIPIKDISEYKKELFKLRDRLLSTRDSLDKSLMLY